MKDFLSAVPGIVRSIPPVLLAVFAWIGHAEAVGIDAVQAGNVTPFSLELVWETTEVSLPGLEVYADAGETVSLEGEVGITFFPLHSGDPDIGDDFVGRERARSLRTETAARKLVHVRVSGLAPGTAYWLRPKVVDGDGEDITDGGPLALVEVTTAESNAFVAESRQLLLEFGGYDPGDSEGAILRLSVPGLPYPLFAVVGDGPVATRAFLNLDQLLDAGGQTNLNPTAPLLLSLRLLGEGVVPGAMPATVPFGGGMVTAAITRVPFVPDTAEPDSYAFDAIASQQVGESFTVTIRALDAAGQPLIGYEGTVDVGSNLALQEGEGTTPAFTEGVLSGYAVTVGEAGEATLTATETGGTATGQSDPFTVAALLWSLTANTLPASGGTVMGGGSYEDGETASLTASAVGGYQFDRWVGAPVADPGSAATTLFMGSDQAVTAVFTEQVLISSYEEWKPGAFLRAAGDPVLTAPDQDPDHDGWPNLLEYCFGTSPLFADRPERPPAILGGHDGPVLRYPRRSGAGDLTIRIEVSHTLGEDWEEHTPDPEDVSVAALGDGMEEIEVRLPDPTPENPGFYRIQVLQTNP